MTTFSDEVGSIPNIDALKDFIKESGNGGPNTLYFLSDFSERKLRKLVVSTNTRIRQYGNRWEMDGFGWQLKDGSLRYVENGDHIVFNNDFHSLIFTSWWHVYAYRLRNKLGEFEFEYEQDS